MPGRTFRRRAEHRTRSTKTGGTRARLPPAPGPGPLTRGAPGRSPRGALVAAPAGGTETPPSRAKGTVRPRTGRRGPRGWESSHGAVPSASGEQQRAPGGQSGAQASTSGKEAPTSPRLQPVLSEKIPSSSETMNICGAKATPGVCSSAPGPVLCPWGGARCPPSVAHPLPGGG